VRSGTEPKGKKIEGSGRKKSRVAGSGNQLRVSRRTTPKKPGFKKKDREGRGDFDEPTTSTDTGVDQEAKGTEEK